MNQSLFIAILHSRDLFAVTIEDSSIVAAEREAEGKFQSHSQRNQANRVAHRTFCFSGETSETWKTIVRIHRRNRALIERASEIKDLSWFIFPFDCFNERTADWLVDEPWREKLSRFIKWKIDFNVKKKL